MTAYPQEAQQIMRKFYNTLSEKDKRRYAATEAIKFGHGGVSIIAEILGCARSTIHIGIAELKALPTDCGYDPAIRSAGGGRKPYHQTQPDIDSAFLAVVKNHTAGDPMDETVRWTNLTHAEIAQRLNDEHGIIVSQTVVRQLLKKHDFVRRKAQKKKPSSRLKTVMSNLKTSQSYRINT
jgi:transposase